MTEQKEWKKQKRISGKRMEKKNKDREKEAQLGQNIIIFLKLKKKKLLGKGRI